MDSSFAPVCSHIINLLNQDFRLLASTPKITLPRRPSFLTLHSFTVTSQCLMSLFFPKFLDSLSLTNSGHALTPGPQWLPLIYHGQFLQIPSTQPMSPEAYPLFMKSSSPGKIHFKCHLLFWFSQTSVISSSVISPLAFSNCSVILITL